MLSATETSENGPAGSEVTAPAGRLNRPKRRVIPRERFVPDADFDETGAAGTLAASGMAVNEARVLFRRSAKEARWRAIESLTLLELAQTVGLELPFSCRSGYCQTCQCRIIEGEALYAYAPLCAPAPGHALLCCARPASAVLVLDA
jgi:ferredoxin